LHFEEYFPFPPKLSNNPPKEKESADLHKAQICKFKRSVMKKMKKTPFGCILTGRTGKRDG